VSVWLRLRVRFYLIAKRLSRSVEYTQPKLAYL
jgi:hypothetical protein